MFEAAWATTDSAELIQRDVCVVLKAAAVANMTAQLLVASMTGFRFTNQTKQPVSGQSCLQGDCL